MFYWLQILLAVSAVFGVVLYRMSMMASFNVYENDDSIATKYSVVIIPATAATINLACIMILNYVSVSWLIVFIFFFLNSMLFTVFCKTVLVSFDKLTNFKVNSCLFMQIFLYYWYIVINKSNLHCHKKRLILIT